MNLRVKWHFFSNQDFSNQDEGITKEKRIWRSASVSRSVTQWNIKYFNYTLNNPQSIQHSITYIPTLTGLFPTVARGIAVEDPECLSALEHGRLYSYWAKITPAHTSLGWGDVGLTPDCVGLCCSFFIFSLCVYLCIPCRHVCKCVVNGCV